MKAEIRNAGEAADTDEPLTPTQYRERLGNLLGRISVQLQSARSKFGFNDVRHMGFVRFFRVINGAWMISVFVEQSLNEDNWWNATFGIVDPKTAEVRKQSWSMDVMRFSAFGLVQLSMSMIETTLRILVRAVSPGACRNGTAEFKAIYEHLLKTKLAVSSEFVELLDLMRMVRNTIHNNARHFHQSGVPSSVSYRGITYTFGIGTPLKFVNAEFIFARLDDLLELLVAVVEHPVIASVAEEIRDPVSVDPV